ncbi:transglutaminase-like domain-containing protein, partial [Xanthomonas citri]
MGRNVYQRLIGALGLCLALVAASAWASTPAPQETTLRLLLQQPEGSIDLARAKITIDRMIDPSIDTEATLREVDQWAAKARARFPAGASNKVKMDLLISTLYEPGPWNDHRPFGYDYTDPFGQDVNNGLLSHYFATRKGQCVIMPIAFLVIGQRLGLPLTMTTAPYHLIVKYGDEEQGQWTNFEATSALFHPDSGYEQAMSIPPEATRNDTFLRPFSQRETAALFATASLLPHYRAGKQAERMLAASDLI